MTSSLPFSPKRDPQTGAFVNLHPAAAHGLPSVLKWKFGRGPVEAPVLVDPAPAAATPYRTPRVEPDLARLREPERDRWQITWIGHSTFLVQINGLSLLTDPIFSWFCSPVPMWSLRRRSRPGLSLRDLPKIDAVLLSHNHYDHLDRPTLRRLGKEPLYLAPFGVGRGLRTWGLRAAELGWGQSVGFRGLRFHAVPAQHFSGRGLLDRNLTLWCGWVIDAGENRRLYFAGDTGYGPFFETIREHYGPFDAALLPIGAYAPRWIMQPVHVDAAEAVRIHRELGGPLSFGMHWGTFGLTDEAPGEPPLALAHACRAAGVAADRFRPMRLGETAVA